MKDPKTIEQTIAKALESENVELTEEQITQLREAREETERQRKEDKKKSK